MSACRWPRLQPRCERHARRDRAHQPAAQVYRLPQQSERQSVRRGDVLRVLEAAPGCGALDEASMRLREEFLAAPAQHPNLWSCARCRKRHGRALRYGLRRRRSGVDARVRQSAPALQCERADAAGGRRRSRMSACWSSRPRRSAASARGSSRTRAHAGVTVGSRAMPIPACAPARRGQGVRGHETARRVGKMLHGAIRCSSSACALPVARRRKHAVPGALRAAL